MHKKSIKLIYRHPNPGFFSIEKVFNVVKSELHDQVDFETIELPYTTKGIFSIISNLWFLFRLKKGFFHIIGDVHYAIFALPSTSTILTIHDLVFMHSHRGINRWLLKWVFLKLPVRKAKFITTISDKTKDEIIQFTGCDPNKIYVITNPVDTKIHFEKKQFSEQKPTLLFLGTKPNKNVELSIPALSGLNLHLRIIGRLSLRQMELLNKFSIDFSCAENITNNQLSAEYINADIIFFPSTYEGFGLPIIEGFQAGRPVITSDMAPMNAIASDAALLVDPFSIASIRDSVVQLISNPHLRETLVEKGFEVVQKYQPRDIAKQYEEMYSQL
jgi:glycosyltransferase involved in cell wall biosynthesis